MNSNLEQWYEADGYVRLSREDGDKEESDSIVNQKELILDFLKKHPEIKLRTFRVDDGFTGINFDRPAFQEMLEDVKKGAVKCIIVKDLSRFGRNYIEVGKYIEKLFPYLGVRFIAINDNYDSGKEGRQTDNIVVPFKNLINDAYCRDISLKVRSHLEIKRNKGDYIGPFAPYGYQKSKENKNKLVIDEIAADIVRDIFKYYLKGYNAHKIASFLNLLGVLPPADYKRFKGSRFYTGFKTGENGTWTNVTVSRILQNETYTGTVIQGKYSTPNYKIKSKRLQPEELWSKVENQHEAIISREEFAAVGRLLKVDTRTSPKAENLHVLSGLLKCGDCGSSMVKKIVPSNGKKYQYFVCGGNKYNKNCTTHNISAGLVEKCVLKMLNLHIKQVVELEDLLLSVSKSDKVKALEKKRQELIREKQVELDRFSALRLSLYEDYQDEIISKADFLELKQIYSERIQKITVELERFMNEDVSVEIVGESSSWIQTFKRYGEMGELTREGAVTLVEEILIYENRRMEIHFCYHDQYNVLAGFVDGLKGQITKQNSEVV